MSKGDTFENSLMLLLFNNTNIANLGDATGVRGSTAAGNLTIALHTADPGEAGTQSTSETAYTGYARVSIARSAGGWTVTNNSASPVANIDFGLCTASPGAALTHFSVGNGVSNGLLYSGTITPNIAVAVNVIPRLTTATAITED